MSWLRTEGGAFWLVFVVAFLGVAVWESLRPRRELSEPVERRWGKHSLLLLVSFAVSAVLVPVSPMLMAASVAGSRYGLLNKPWLPFAARWILAVLILDLAKYATHRALHSVYFLWRVHQVHHSDRDFDVSTSVRGHPIETILFHGASLATIAILAPPLGAVLAAELMSVFESFFSHANASLPEWLQRGLGVVFYTADTHRIHHSVDIRMQNSNFGDIFPWWDRVFGTYLHPFPAGEDRIVIGLEECQSGASPGFVFMLKQPFLPDPYGRSDRPTV
jgi:sterol desaturase/sphingolipid hydroxylase (fatty acid hydroxylase superfamily)